MWSRLPIAEFEMLVAEAAAMGRRPDVRHTVTEAMLRRTVRSPVEASRLMSRPFRDRMARGDVKAVAAAAACCAAAGIPTVLEGLCLVSPAVVDAVDVLVWTGSVWAPAGIEGPVLPRSPVHRVRIRVDQ